MSLENAVETAVKMETDAIEFYSEAINKTSHSLGKEIFRGFIAEEQRHLKMLKDILNNLDIKVDSASPGKDLKTVFTELKEQMMQRVSATADEIEAVKVALDFEKEGYNFYLKASLDADTEKERTLFNVLAKEEKRHYSILENTHRFFQDTGDWFMWEEQGILEGG